MIQVNKINTLSGHRDCVYTLEQAVAAPRRFFSAGGDGIVASWDLEKPEIGDLIAKVPNSIYALCAEPLGNNLLIAQNFEGIHRIDLEQKKELKSVKITKAAIFDMKIHQDELIVACGDGRVLILDSALLAVKKYLAASDKSARCIAISPRHSELAVGYSDDCIRIFDLENKQLKYTIQAHKNSVFTLAYSPNEDFLLSGSRDAHLKIWDVQQKYHLQESIIAHMYALNHLVYSPDGLHFATASMDKSIKIWDSHTFKLCKVIDRARHAGHGTSINKLLWSAHRQQLISGSDDRLISVWQLDFDEH